MYVSLSKMIFASRWLQAPLYFGLIIVLMIYVVQFGIGLIHLMRGMHLLREYELMLQALDLIDVVMIANLLIMVIMGGYETFVSKLKLNFHPDQPEWLDKINAGTMKVKVALALIGISSIHLLRTFIDPSTKDNFVIMWQVIIHMTLLISALAVAFTDNLTTQSHHLSSPKKSDS